MSLKLGKNAQGAFILILFALVSAPSISAEELPYPPTYFSIFRVDLSVALDVAKNCQNIDIDREKYEELSEEQMRMLERDGFSPENWRSEMKDVPAGLRDRPRVEFYMKWGVEAGDPQSYCHAGKMEISNRTTIGSLLVLTQ